MDAFPIADFRLLSPIGTGEFGQVYRALWFPRGIEVAIKDVEPRAGQAKATAERDGIALQALIAERHPGIVPEVHCHGEADGHYYIAMEYVAGESLQRIMRRKQRLLPRDAARLGAALARVLHLLHGFRPDGPDTEVRPIVHSDLKPEHVLVLPDGTLRVIDFGIAKQTAIGAVTHNGFVSVEYALPERLIDLKVHPDDDVWALGIMLFEMIAGAHPRERFRGRISDAVNRNDWTTAAALLREQPGELPDACPPQLEAVVLKMLSSQPEHRYRTAAELAQDLDAFLTGGETRAWKQLAAAGRATRVVSRSAAAAPGTPTVAVPPPSPTVGPTTTARAAAAASPPALPPPLPPAAVTVMSAPPPLPQPSSGGQEVRLKPDTTYAGQQARPAVVPARRGGVLQSRRGAAIRAFAALVILLMVLGEGAVWVKAVRFLHRIPSIDAADVDRVPDALSQVRRGGIVGAAVPLMVIKPLAARLGEIADTTIEAYRTDEGSPKAAQWKQAQQALAVATDLRPSDTRLRSRLRYVQAHLARIDAQGKPPDAARGLAAKALDGFREAARLDGSWPDPFLGMASVHAYALRDLDALIADVDQAARRGFTAGKRERAELADGYRWRADAERQNAARADPVDRRTFLAQAAADYQNCLTNYEGLAGYFNAGTNADYCRRRFTALSAELDGPADF